MFTILPFPFFYRSKILPIERWEEKKFINPMDSRPDCGVPRGAEGRTASKDKRATTIADLVSSNEIKETERKEAGVQTVYSSEHCQVTL